MDVQLPELRGGEGDQRRLGELGPEQHTVGMPGDAPVGEPQLARVVLDDFEQREPERRPGVGVGRRPHRARGARTSAAVRAEPGALNPDHTLKRDGKLILDESDSYGVEMALQLVDAAGGGEVTLVSMAPNGETSGLRTALTSAG